MTEFNREFFQREGRRGGESTKEKYGKHHFSQLATLSAIARKKKRGKDGSLKIK